MKLVKHKVYSEMYCLEWSDGSMSDDFYNKTRAKEYAHRIDARMALRASTEPAGAFK
jgi:hypothetical protein